MEVKIPLMAEIVRKYFCVPCISVKYERLFSQTGLILANNRRSRLSDGTFEMLMTIKYYLLLKKKFSYDQEELVDECEELDIFVDLSV
uniref:HAT C-terminal dimerisation domain-containing protein n=1 Tax=Acrobeloides nanus TaxID=290746 RepID=A0A914C5Z0_9BILA